MANGAAGAINFSLSGEPPKGPDAHKPVEPASDEGHDNGPEPAVQATTRFVLPNNVPD